MLNSAEDNGELVGYNLYKDSEWIAELSSNELEYSINGLIPGQSYEFALEAFDAVNNRSQRQVLIMSLPDGASPYWPESSQITVSAL